MNSICYNVKNRVLLGGCQVYLFLVDSSYISSEQLQKMIGQVLPEEDVVNCFTAATLLSISEKLNPDLVIIDFELVEDQKIDMIETLRKKNPDTYVLALIDQDYYDNLYQAIEKGLIDDYMVKPVSEEEFAARILITTRRRKSNRTFSVPEALPEQEIAETASIDTPYVLDDSEFMIYEETDKPEETSEPDLIAEPEDLKADDLDFFKPLSADQYLHRPEKFDVDEAAINNQELQFPEQPDFEVDAGDLSEQDEVLEDIFDDELGFSEIDKTIDDHAQTGKIDLPKDNKELGEEYFNDLFLEQYEEEEKADPADQSTIVPPAAAFKSFEEPDSDLNLSIKEFMPGESADQYLLDKELEQDISFDEDMLDRFLGDEDDDDEDFELDEERSAGSGVFSVLINIVLAILLFMMASLSFFLIHSRVADSPPSISIFSLHVMQDNDLDADANPGSLAVVREADALEVSLGDIINYRTEISPNDTATKRVVEVSREEGLQFIVRGDGSGDSQTVTVPADNVLGKVLFSIPYYGYLVDYVQTSLGLILLIFVPGVIIIVYQIIKIAKHLSSGRKSGKKRFDREITEEE